MKGSIGKSLLLLFAIIGPYSNLKAQCPVTVNLNSNASTAILFSQSSVFKYSSSTGNPTFYRIDWDNLLDVNWLSLPQSEIPFTIQNNLPPGIYYGNLYFKNNNNCVSQAYRIYLVVSEKIMIDFNPSSSILSTGVNFKVCQGTGSKTISYTLTPSNGHWYDYYVIPSEYRIDWNSNANMAGLNDVPMTNLPQGSSFTISNLPFTNGTYTGIIYFSHPSYGILQSGSIQAEVEAKPQVKFINDTLVVCKGITEAKAYLENWSSNLYFPLSNFSSNTWRSDLFTDPTYEFGKFYIRLKDIPVTSGIYSGYYRASNQHNFNSGNNCENLIPFTIKVVDPLQVLTASKTICSGDSPNLQLISSESSASFTWFVKSKSTNVTLTGSTSGSNNSISHIVSNTSSSTQGTIVYSVTPATNSCLGVPKDITITVQPQINAGGIAIDQVICMGGDPALLTQTSAGSGFGSQSFQWQTSSDNASYTNVAGATSSSFDPPAGIMNKTYFKRLSVSSQNGISCNASSNVVTININEVNGGMIGNNQSICQGGDPALISQTSPPSGLGTFFYQWQKSSDNNTYTNIAGATSSTYDPPIDFQQTTFFRRLVTSSVANCNALSNVTTISLSTNPREVITNFPALPVKTYGNTSFTLSATVPSGLMVSYSSSNPAVATVSDNTVTIVGAGSTTITASQAGNSTYCPANNLSQTLIVNKATLTASPTNASRTYGAANPTFGVTYTGFVNGDNPSVIDTQPTTTSTATALSNVGNYPITLTGGSDNNYTITNQVGSLSVTKKDLTAAAVSTSKYVGQPNPPFSINYTGFVNGENSSVLDVKPVATTTATTSSPVGSYPINLSGGSDNNYAYTYVNGVLTVSPVPTCSFYISSTGDLCTEGRIQLRVNATSGTPATYLWSTGLTTSRIPIHWGGTYSVTVTFSNGCTQTESFYVADPVGPGCIYYLKAEPLQFLQTSEYPNPVDAELTIEIASDLLETSTTDIPVNLIDPTGKAAFTSSFKKDMNQIKISTQNMPAGLYVLQIGSGKTGVVRKKVMVVH